MQLFSDTMDETSIQNTIDAYRLFRGLGLHYGFDSYAVVDLRSIGSEFRYKQAVVLHALAEVELDMVDAQANGGEDDPLIAGLASSMAPFMLAADEDGEATPLLSVLGFAALAAAPLATPDGQRYGLVMFSREALSPPDVTRLAALYLDALVVFQTYHDALLAPRAASEFSDRELAILRMTADGRTSVEIACELEVSEHTINANIAALLKRLQVTNRAQMTAKAIRTKLIG
ncbi:helix-turn-helix transcriptional regulator [uncultured Hoeflea sp.]|uniref:helix-turn-helix transcriptional regulator n=1 Tax=uncultured Hoeflea sp. TaxID=538666 RepID=UPI0026073AB1|nr:helix-turn-helix transcriptional regulator [uncultured Hoeflea sp.]